MTNEIRLESFHNKTDGFLYEFFGCHKVEDNEYVYLFLGHKSVCMIDKATVEGGSAEDLKEFVAQRTGL